MRLIVGLRVDRKTLHTAADRIDQVLSTKLCDDEHQLWLSFSIHLLMDLGEVEEPSMPELTRIIREANQTIPVNPILYSRIENRYRENLSLAPEAESVEVWTEFAVHTRRQLRQVNPAGWDDRPWDPRLQMWGACNVVSKASVLLPYPLLWSPERLVICRYNGEYAEILKDQSI